MELLFDYISQHADSAHWIIFLLLMLAGLNVPISEDLLLLFGGALTSICIPDKTWLMFFWIFAGCWFSAWEAYGLGRHFGPRICKFRWFKKFLTQEKLSRLQGYYEKFGIFTFIIGRFIPGGVRNALFMSAGLAKMPFYKFVMRDGIACAISSSTIFYLGLCAGENYRTIQEHFQKYSLIALFYLIALFALGGLYLWSRSNKINA